MSTDLLTCPKPTYLANTPNPTCPVRWDQILKLGIRRINGRATLTTSTILLSATVTPLLTAVDDTKLLITPNIKNIVIPNAEPIKEGGNDNTTFNGMPELRGLGIVQVTGAYMDNVDDTTAVALRALASESSLNGDSNIEMFPITRFAKGVLINPSTTIAYGIKIYNFVVSDVSSEGYNKPNRYYISWDMEGGWSAGVKMFTPTDYNLLSITN